MELEEEKKSTEKYIELVRQKMDLKLKLQTELKIAQQNKEKKEQKEEMAIAEDVRAISELVCAYDEENAQSAATYATLQQQQLRRN